MMERLFRDRGFVIHAAVYLGVNVLLAVIDVFTSPESLWFYWPLLGWGLGLLGHAYAVTHAAATAVDGSVTEQEKTMPIKATEVEEYARKLWEAHGARSIAEAAQKAQTYENAGDAEQAETWRRIESALKLKSGPRES
jgi:hypothetical protein